MRVLLTGICGFAGSVLARGLLDHLSIDIQGLDNLSRRGSETNLEPLRALGMDIQVADIRRESDLASLPPVDWVIDCAANPSVLAGVDGKTDARELLDHNLIGTINLLEYCRRHKAGFLLLSTSRVYAIEPLAGLQMEVRDNAYTPSSPPWPVGVSEAGVNEDFSTDAPISLYGASKKCSEILALEYGRTFGFPVRINRCGVLAGAGQFGKADQGIFSFWIHSWARQRDLSYIGFGGHGYQVRDCLHPRDLVPLIARQLQDPGHPAPPVLNFAGGSDHAMSLAQLSHWCSHRYGPRSVRSIQERRPYDIPWMVLDANRAQSAWNWKPQTSAEQILEEIADHADKNPFWLEAIS